MAAMNGTLLNHPNNALNLASEFRSASVMPVANALPQANTGKPQHFMIDMPNNEGTISHAPVISISSSQAKIMSLRIAVDETGSRRRVMTAGGKRDPNRQVCQISHEKITEGRLSGQVGDNELFQRFLYVETFRLGSVRLILFRRKKRSSAK